MSDSQLVAVPRRAPSIWARVARLCNLVCEEQFWNPLRDLLADATGPELRDQLLLIIDCCIAAMAVPQLASKQVELLSGRDDLDCIVKQVQANSHVQALAPSEELVRDLTVQRLGNVLAFLRLTDNQFHLAIACSEAFDSVAGWRSGEFYDYEAILDSPDLTEEVLRLWLSPQQARRLVELNALRIAGVKAAVTAVTAVAEPVIDAAAIDVAGDMALLYGAGPLYPESLLLRAAETVLVAGRVWTGCVWPGRQVQAPR